MKDMKDVAGATIENKQGFIYGMDVVIDKIEPDCTYSYGEDRYRAVVSVYMGGFAVHGIHVYENDRGTYVRMPSYPYGKSEGVYKYEEAFCPIDKEFRDAMLMCIKEKFSLEKSHMLQSHTIKPPICVNDYAL